MKPILRFWITALLGLVSLAAAGESVGTVVTPGRLLMNRLSVEGNAPVADGAVLKTTTAAARVELVGGGVVALDAGSEAVVRRGRLQLRSGRGMVAGGSGEIEALGFQVNGGEPRSQVLVGLAGGKLEVAAIRGFGKVRNTQGATLAMVHEGQPLSFEPGPAGGESRLTGTLRRQGAKYIIRDELTGVDVELRGAGLTAAQGRRVEATGNSQIAGDSENHVVVVSRLKLLGPAERTSGPNAGSSGTTAKATAAAAKTGMSAGTKIAVAALTFGGMATAIAVPLAMSN